MASKAADQPERYRVIFNDTENYIQSMLATRMLLDSLIWIKCSDFHLELNHVVTSDSLKKGSIARLTQFQPNTVKDKRLALLSTRFLVEACSLT